MHAQIKPASYRVPGLEHHVDGIRHLQPRPHLEVLDVEGAALVGRLRGDRDPVDHDAEDAERLGGGSVESFPVFEHHQPCMVTN